MTPLDQAYAAMEATPGDDAARLRFYERLADGEMVVLLREEPAGEDLVPHVFELEDGPVVLIFDSEERLAAFTGIPAPYAALPGRVVASLLAGQGVGLGINLGVAPSSMLLPPDAVDWLAEILKNAPEAAEALPEQFLAPANLPDALLRALDAKLARAAGLASRAVLCMVVYQGGRRGHLLAFVDAVSGAEAPLARAVAEALTFSGVEAGELDVTFLSSEDISAQSMASVGLQFDLPTPTPVERGSVTAPGMDPDRPPILR